MQAPRSDAIVVFGVTGDLVHKEIFPAIYGLFRDEDVSVPVIGVARSDWSMERTRRPGSGRGGEPGHQIDEKIFARLAENLHYVRGDYGAPETYEQDVRRAQGTGSTLFYMAIPPSVFPVVTNALASSGCSLNSRVLDREAVRPRSALRPRTEQHAAHALPGVVHLPHRPLPG